MSRTLFDACVASGAITIHFRSRLCDLDFESTRFCVQEGESTRWLDADVILAADGVKSCARIKMLAAMNQPDEGASSPA